VSTQATILVVDDQPELLEALMLTLTVAGYRALGALNGQVALTRLEEEPVDLIIADIAMPQLNGYQLFERVRARPEWVAIPFLFLTARALDSDVRYGKTMGADDYLTKPFQLEDLLASVAGRLRRFRELNRAVQQREPAPGAPVALPTVIELGRLRMAPQQHRVWMGQQEVELTSREFKVLEYLSRRAEEVVEPRQLLMVSHGIETDNVEAGHLLRPLIHSLRRKLGYPSGEVGCIENVRGVGYRLNPPA
jgi:DNA-binding response OmpR family regulator